MMSKKIILVMLVATLALGLVMTSCPTSGGGGDKTSGEKDIPPDWSKDGNTYTWHNDDPKQLAGTFSNYAVFTSPNGQDYYEVEFTKSRGDCWYGMIFAAPPVDHQNDEGEWVGPVTPSFLVKVWPATQKVAVYECGVTGNPDTEFTSKLTVSATKGLTERVDTNIKTSDGEANKIKVTKISEGNFNLKINDGTEISIQGVNEPTIPETYSIRMGVIAGTIKGGSEPIDITAKVTAP